MVDHLQSLVRHNYSRTRLIQTPKGQSEGFVLERCPYKIWCRHFSDSTYSFKRSVAKTRFTLVFKLAAFKVVNSQYKDTVFQ